MKELRNVDELRRFVSVNDIALVGFVSKDDEVREYIKKLFTKLEVKTGHIISFALLEVDDKQELRTLEDVNYVPLIRLYFKGKNVFEQESYFGNLQTDYYVLRVSVRDVLRQFGIRLISRNT